MPPTPTLSDDCAERVLFGVVWRLVRDVEALSLVGHEALSPEPEPEPARTLAQATEPRARVAFGSTFLGPEPQSKREEGVRSARGRDEDVISERFSVGM